MTDQDDTLTLRDKFACAMLETILADGSNSNFISDFVEVFDYSDPIGDQDSLKRSTYRRMERKIRAAYKIADMMRKVRLLAFD